MQADTSPVDGGYAVVYMNEATPIKQGDMISNLTFLKTVTLDNSITTTITGTIRSWFSPRLSLNFTLTPTSFTAVDMYGTINNITYTSVDGISYIRTDEYDDSYNIGNLTIPSLNENILKFMVNKIVSFGGLYRYNEANTEYELVETQLGDMDQLDIITGKSVYGNNGIIRGTLPNYSSSSVSISYKGETGSQLSMQLSSLSNARVSNNTTFYASNNELAPSIGLVPSKIKSGEVILGVEGNYTGNVDKIYGTIMASNTKVYDYDNNTQVQKENGSGFATPLYGFNDAGEEQVCVAPYRTSSGGNTTRYIYIYDKATAKYVSLGLLNLQSYIDSNIVSNSISYIGISNVKNGKFRLCHISYNNVDDVKVPYLYVYDIYISSSSFSIDTSNMWKCPFPSSFGGKSSLYTQNMIPMFSGDNNEYISMCVSYGGGFISQNQRVYVSIKLLDEQDGDTKFKKSQVNISAITNYSAPVNANTPSILCNNKIVIIPMGSGASTTMKCQLIVMNDEFAPIRVNEFSYQIYAVNSDGTRCIANNGGSCALYDIEINFTTGDIVKFNKLRDVALPISQKTCYCVSRDSKVITFYNNGDDTNNTCTCIYINWEANGDNIFTVIGTLSSMAADYIGPIPDGSGIVGLFRSGTPTTTFNRLLCSKKTLISFVYDGVVGYITSDANVVCDNLLVNKVAYGNDGRLTGTMPNNGALNYTPTTSQQTIPAGYTSGGIIEAIDYSGQGALSPQDTATAEAQIEDLFGEGE